MRTTLGQVQLSRLPEEIGKCQNDLPGIAGYVNQAQQQLINCGGETGFWGGWTRAVFQATQCHPYITLPRQFARVINMDVCRFPIKIQNEFYEMLPDGIGLQDFCRPGQPDWCGALEGYERGVFPTMRDIDTTNQYVRVYYTDARDVGRRILFGPSQDQNGNYIYNQDGLNSVNGFYLTLAAPFATTGFIVTNIGGVQKDATYGDVLVYQVDATTGAQVLLSRYGPDEITPAYRRYFIHRLPCSCNPVQTAQNPCTTPTTTPGTVQITALAKFEFIPANRPTDFLIIGNIPALIEECKAIRYSGMDVPNAARMQDKCHSMAIKYLNDELRHYLGEFQPAINFAPFGTARLQKQRIGLIM